MKNGLLILLCACTLPGVAQNVGIGTRQPLSTLHVAGSLRVDSLATHSSPGLVMHDKAGEVHSISLTGKITDVLRGDGSFAPMAAAAAAPYWQTNGNAGVDTALNFLGTTDNKALLFRVNNIRAGGIQPQGGNIALGLRSLQQNKYAAGGGYSNIALGTDALRNNKSGKNLIAIGDSALFRQTGSTVDAFYNPEENMAVGSKALYSNMDGGGNTAIGVEALYKNNNEANTAVGFKALHDNTGNANTAVGNYALTYNTSGIFNTGIGYAALLLGGSNSTAVGFTALEAVKGNGNTAVGSGALSGGPAMASAASANSTYNTAVGYEALSSYNVQDEPNVNLGNNNAALGAFAMYNNVKGYNNVALGTYALYTNSSAFGNTATGYKAMYAASTGGGNTAHGYQAMLNLTTGIYNTAIGYSSMATNTTGNFNTTIGMNADVSSAGLTNSTAIGYNTKVDASNKVRIGNAAVTKIEGQVPFTTPSDGRFKYNIRNDVGGLNFILRLRPVTYQFDVRRFDGVDPMVQSASYDQAAAIRRTGFIAQEVDKAARDAGYDFSGVVRPETAEGHYSLSYESFVAPLVRAVQEQQIIINRQQQQIDELLTALKEKGILTSSAHQKKDRREK